MGVNVSMATLRCSHHYGGYVEVLLGKNHAHHCQANMKN